MSSSNTTAVAITASVAAIGAGLWMSTRSKNKSSTPSVPSFLTDSRYQSVVEILRQHLDQLTGDELVKIVRQLDYWINQ